MHHAIVWQDTRTDAQLRRFDEAFGEKNFRERTGLPLAPYFAGSKLAWLLEHVDGLRERGRARRGAVRHHGQLADLEADRTITSPT